MPPKFVHVKEKDLPHFTHSGAQLRLIVGTALGEVSPIEVHSDIFYVNAQSPADNDFVYDLGPHQEGAVYLIKGKIQIGDDQLEPGAMAIFKQGSEMKFQTLEDAEFMLLGGDKFATIPTVWWNLVSHSKERIEQAKLDWKEGRFEKVPNETQFIPLPES